MLPLSSLSQRPYRSKKQKPCNACRRRRAGCIREGSFACAFCTQRNLDCIVEPDLQAQQGNLDSLKTRSQRARASVDPVSLQDSTRTLASTSNRLNPTNHPRSNSSSRQTLQYVGPSGDYDSFILQHRTWEEPEDFDSAEWTCRRINRDLSNPVHFSTFPDEHLDAYPSYYPRNVVEESVMPFREGLVKAYFEYVHTSFAILGPQTPSTIAKSATLMSSIYCLAQAYFTPAQSLDPWLFTDFNKQALHIETHNVKLETVEAGLLFAQRHARLIRAPTMPGMCAEIGSIIGMSHDLGLNIDPVDWDISDTERRRRRRLWWGVYVQDKWSALTLGRPSYLHDEQNDVSMLTMADFALEGSLQPSPANANPAQLFIGVTTLSTILSEILATLFTVKAINSCQAMELEELESICTSLEDKLKEWQVKHLEPALAKRSFPDPTGSLELAFYTVQITLYRGILRSVLSKFSKSDPFFAYLRQRGKEVASSVLKLLELLSVARSSAFWWSTSKINFAIAGSFMISMFLCSVSGEESQYWMDQVIFYRKLLRAHINGFDVTKHASIRLDLLANSRGAGEFPKSPPDSTCPAQQFVARSESWEIENMPLIEDLDMDWLSSLPAELPFNTHNFGLI